MALLNRRVPLSEALKDPQLSEENKRKIQLTEKVRQFAETKLGLAATKNYSRFVKLETPYVTYVVSAAPKWELTHYLWKFPFVGAVPYKGYFEESDAVEEENELKKLDLDTYRRGVSAYSTLGWMEDPLLSSMLAYKEHDLVNTIIHETTHATLYIKSSADFNERLANFVGTKGAELFYLELEGPQSPTYKKMQDELADEKLFSQFIGQELKSLEQWYKDNPPNNKEKDEDLRLSRIATIQENFKKNIQPLLKSDSYSKFAGIQLNNARLLVYKTYVQDWQAFEDLYKAKGSDMKAFIQACKQLEKHPNPDEALKTIH